LGLTRLPDRYTPRRAVFLSCRNRLTQQAQTRCRSPKGHPIERGAGDIALAGEIDTANAEDYLALARAIIAGGPTDACLTIDLSGVTFMSSIGLGLMVQIRKAATDAGMQVRLVRVPKRVIELLEITALADVFAVVDASPS
jgi:anti-anti-sigma factor